MAINTEFGYDTSAADDLGIALKNKAGEFADNRGEERLKQLLAANNSIAIQVHLERVRRRMDVFPPGYPASKGKAP